METRPYLEDGTPFPTLFYLTCPSAVAAIGRLEEKGGVEVFRRTVQNEPRVERALAMLTEAYARRRRERAQASPHSDGGAVLERGIGGPAADRATCLHAQAAAMLAALADAGLSGDWTPTDVRVLRDLLRGFGDLWCDDERCAAFGSPGPLRAAIDVGTNSVRLLVARSTATGVHPVIRDAEVTRLGEGLAADRAEGGVPTLDPAARARTAAVVDRYVAEARRTGAEVIRLVGTSACREAEDGREFIAELGRRHDVEAVVVSGEAEAALGYAGATLDIAGPVVLLDVGGGSTELVTRGGCGHVPDDLEAVSLPIGCVTGTERWFRHDPPTPEERADARREVVAAVAPYRTVYGRSPSGPAEGPGGTAVDRSPAGLTDTTLVGVAGTITTLACLALELAAYDPDLIHLRRITVETLAGQHGRLAALGAADRASLPCMQEGRAEVIVAGGEILLGVMEALGWRDVVVSERDLLDGIVLADTLVAGE